MIFSIPGHIEMIKSGDKTETRRQSGVYSVGRSYSIQERRTGPGSLEGRIRILKKRVETINDPPISVESAWAEGKYEALEFEKLYNDLYPGWNSRFAYTFEYVRTLRARAMTIAKEQAQARSLEKWKRIKEDFNAVFFDTNMPCGYCTYSIERTEKDSVDHKCRLCKQEFPEIYRICKEMVDFFSAKHGELDKMIKAIIKTIEEAARA